MPRWWRRLALALLFATAGSMSAQAHARLERTVPAAGSTVHVAPEWIELLFSETPEAVFSRIEVLDQKGEHIEEGKPKIQSGNGKVLRIALKPITAGTYKVTWRVFSVDTHLSSGSFSFTVAL